ncbi:hypothetical protein C4K40_3469 [Pseudomonas sp. CMR5c]|nr:hypothetical protein C4K40_3469 [Pseudomonas sp. CMR5c]
MFEVVTAARPQIVRITIYSIKTTGWIGNPALAGVPLEQLPSC